MSKKLLKTIIFVFQLAHLQKTSSSSGCPARGFFGKGQPAAVRLGHSGCHFGPNNPWIPSIPGWTISSLPNNLKIVKNAIFCSFFPTNMTQLE